MLSPFFVKAHRDGGSSDGGNDDNTFDLPKPTLIGEFWDQVGVGYRCLVRGTCTPNAKRRRAMHNAFTTSCSV